MAENNVEGWPRHTGPAGEIRFHSHRSGKSLHSLSEGAVARSHSVLKSSLRTKEYRSKTEVGLAKKSRKQNARGWRCKEKTCGEG